MSDKQQQGSGDNRPKRRKRTRRRKKKKGGAHFVEPERNWPTDPYPLLITRFQSCPQCGFFLTGYRAAFGQAITAEIADNADGNWLDLGWHTDMPRILKQSHGIQLDGVDAHLELCCERCQRVMVLERSEAEVDSESAAPADQPTYAPLNLRIQIMPQRAVSTDA